MRQVLLILDQNQDEFDYQAQLEQVGAEVTLARLNNANLPAAELPHADICLTSSTAIPTIAHIRSSSQHPMPIIVFGENDAVTATEAMRLGAEDYWVTGASGAMPDSQLHKLMDCFRLPSTTPLPAKESRRAFDLASRVAKIGIPVLITGESGTGKEVVARYVHSESNRSNKPFIAVNCAAIPENMLEATMFGHEKGAFTGAQQSREGKFQQADGGTLLLDEIGELPLELQSKLLRAIQEQEVEPIGGKKPIPVNVRIIATTNVDLPQAMKDKRFREDLFYRLSVFPISLAPLRERTEDIDVLVAAFIKKYCQKFLLLEQPVNPEIMDKLRAYAWPGNVRELENSIQRALVLAGRSAFKLEHFELKSASENLPSGLSDKLENEEFQMIFEAIKANQGRRADTAASLGISERTLRYKIARMRTVGMEIPRRR